MDLLELEVVDHCGEVQISADLVAALVTPPSGGGEVVVHHGEKPTTRWWCTMVKSRHQVVVVTGASSGIGREVAVMFHREGARWRLISRVTSVTTSIANI